VKTLNLRRDYRDRNHNNSLRRSVRPQPTQAQRSGAEVQINGNPLRGQTVSNEPLGTGDIVFVNADSGVVQQERRRVDRQTKSQFPQFVKTGEIQIFTGSVLANQFIVGYGGLSKKFNTVGIIDLTVEAVVEARSDKYSSDERDYIISVKTKELTTERYRIHTWKGKLGGSTVTPWSFGLKNSIYYGDGFWADNSGIVPDCTTGSGSQFYRARLRLSGTYRGTIENNGTLESVQGEFNLLSAASVDYNPETQELAEITSGFNPFDPYFGTPYQSRIYLAGISGNARNMLGLASANQPTGGAVGFIQFRNDGSLDTTGLLASLALNNPAQLPQQFSYNVESYSYDLSIVGENTPPPSVTESSPEIEFQDYSNNGTPNSNNNGEAIPDDLVYKITLPVWNQRPRPRWTRSEQNFGALVTPQNNLFQNRVAYETGFLCNGQSTRRIYDYYFWQVIPFCIDLAGQPAVSEVEDYFGFIYRACYVPTGIGPWASNDPNPMTPTVASNGSGTLVTEYSNLLLIQKTQHRIAIAAIDGQVFSDAQSFSTNLEKGTIRNSNSGSRADSGIYSLVCDSALGTGAPFEDAAGGDYTTHRIRGFFTLFGGLDVPGSTSSTSVDTNNSTQAFINFLTENTVSKSEYTDTPTTPTFTLVRYAKEIVIVDRQGSRVSGGGGAETRFIGIDNQTEIPTTNLIYNLLPPSRNTQLYLDPDNNNHLRIIEIRATQPSYSTQFHSGLQWNVTVYQDNGNQFVAEPEFTARNAKLNPPGENSQIIGIYYVVA
jgi:hypothetical protein